MKVKGRLRKVMKHEAGEKTLIFTSTNSREDRNDGAEDQCEMGLLGGGCSKVGFGSSTSTRWRIHKVF